MFIAPDENNKFSSVRAAETCFAPTGLTDYKTRGAINISPQGYGKSIVPRTVSISLSPRPDKLTINT
jgi:hypothetical protein